MAEFYFRLNKLLDQNQEGLSPTCSYVGKLKLIFLFQYVTYFCCISLLTLSHMGVEVYMMLKSHSHFGQIS